MVVKINNLEKYRKAKCCQIIRFNHQTKITLVPIKSKKKEIVFLYLFNVDIVYNIID